MPVEKQAKRAALKVQARQRDLEASVAAIRCESARSEPDRGVNEQNGFLTQSSPRRRLEGPALRAQRADVELKA